MGSIIGLVSSGACRAASSAVSASKTVANKVSTATAGAFEATKQVAERVRSIGASGLGSVQKAVEAVNNGIAKGKKAYDAVYHPQETLNRALQDSLANLNITERVKSPRSATKKKVIDVFCEKLQSRKNNFATKLIVKKLKSTPNAQTPVEQAKLAATQEKKSRFVASVVSSVVTEANAQKLSGTVFDATSRVLESIHQIAKGSESSQIKASLLGSAGTPPSNIDQVFEKEKKALETKVHKNICALLNVSRKNAKPYTLQHLIFLVMYVAVKFFNVHSVLLNSIHDTIKEGINRSPELSQQLDGYSEFLFYKCLESATTELLHGKPMSKADVDQKWSQLVETAGPDLSKILSHKLSQKSSFVKTAGKLGSHLIGGPSAILAKIQPSEILSTAVKGLRNAAHRCLNN